jgi:phosphate butyryltransferase
MIKTMQDLIAAVKNSKRKRLAVAVAQDAEVLQAVHSAYNLGLVDVSLIGDKAKIFEISDSLGIDVSNFEIIKETDIRKAIKTTVDLVSSGRADVLMKGIVQTADLLRVVLDKDIGLRTTRTISHVAMLESPHYHKMLFITDGGMNIAPDLKQKADIVQNAVDVARSIGISTPKVAILGALEIVNSNMQATLDGAVLSKMAERGQLKNCIVDGPLALDNAINEEAARHKGIVSPVAGDVDILVSPDIESANIQYKTMVFLGGAKPCGIITGTKAPVVTTSRADDHIAKLHSIALACLGTIK